MRIYLVGFMGAGKTAVGRCLARRLGWRFVDLDREIERRSGVSVAEIFEREGEPGFRSRETAALRRISRRQRTVVATGGGTLTDPENAEVIRASGRSVFLDAPLEVLFDRVERSARDRPLFSDRAQARALYESRLAAYRSADLVVPVTAEDRPEAVAERVAARLGSEPCVI
ncbi:MAG TPA: shikimate kinase [Thermoanaerobaculia bacterium]|nr:shikimate kinase [Thermoanaerobaculia bacterium]